MKLRPFLLFLLLIVTLPTISSQTVDSKTRLFSFVQIGDIQSANETQLQSIMDFITINKKFCDIQYVVQTGDIVQTYNDEADWEIKNVTFSQLTELVPFGWLAGNHEGRPEFYIGDDYYAFNVSNYLGMTSSYDQSRNTAQYFNFNGERILFVNLEFFANETALGWFKELYYNYYRATVILSTHSYMTATGTYTQDTINASFLNDYPRVRLVLCGHNNFAFNQKVGNRQEILFDYQYRPDSNPDMSDFIRLYTIYTDGTVDALTYSKLRDELITDSKNQFSFNLLFSPLPTPSIEPEPTPTPRLSPEPTLKPTPEPPPSLSPLPTPNPSESELSLITWILAALGVVSVVSAFTVYLKRRK